MRFQTRDGGILTAVYEYDGVLSFRLLKRMFWPEATDRAALKRLSKLVNTGYLVRPTAYHRKTQPVPEPVYWLGWKGIVWVAGQQGVAVSTPAHEGEYQMRKLDKDLRDENVHWLREPRWMQLVHDLAVASFRLSVEQAVRELPACRLETWIHESEFRADGDEVTYPFKERDGTEKQLSKLVYPDSYFVVVDEQHLAQGQLTRARFLLEVDNATHANRRFGREKIAPGLAYIKSPEYKARFSANSGRWLVPTTTEVRMKNLIKQTEKVAGDTAGLFFFTTLDELEKSNILTEPIWHQVGKKDPISLFPRGQNLGL